MTDYHPREKRGPTCPRCGSPLTAKPAELPDGLPGVKYITCGACGASRAVTTRPRRERLPEPRTDS